VQLVEQALMEITGRAGAQRILDRNHEPHRPDRRPSAPWRTFGEKMEIGVPDTAGYRKLIERYMAGPA
jgi:hypothetical protein